MVTLGGHDDGGPLGRGLEAAQVDACGGTHERAHLTQGRLHATGGVGHADERLERVEEVRLAALGLEVSVAPREGARTAVKKAGPQSEAQCGGLLGG